MTKSTNGSIPLLKLDNGNFICKSVAICCYLETIQQPTHSLFGDTALAQANVEMWHRMVELKGLFVAFQAFRNISGVYSDRETIV
jgi:glutathione S-transferase